MIASAITALIYQASKNAVTAAKYSEGWMRYIDAAGGIAVEMFVASAAIGVLYVMRRGKVSHSYAMLGLIGLCVGFGLLAAGQQISVQRTQKTAEVGVKQTVYSSQATQLVKAQEELATIKARPVATVEAAMATERGKTFWDATDGCKDVGKYGNSCRLYGALAAELGLAKRKAELEGRVISLSTAVGATTGSQIATADPIAGLVGSYFELTVENAQIAMAFFSAVTMMMIAMFGIHFGLLVYGADDLPAHAAQSVAPTVMQYAAPVVPTNVTPFQAAHYVPGTGAPDLSQLKLPSHTGIARAVA